MSMSSLSSPLQNGIYLVSPKNTALNSPPYFKRTCGPRQFEDMECLHPCLHPSTLAAQRSPGGQQQQIPQMGSLGPGEKKTEMQIWQKWERTLIFPLWLTKLRHSSKSSFKQEEKPTLKEWEEDNLLWIHAMKLFHLSRVFEEDARADEWSGWTVADKTQRRRSSIKAYWRSWADL